jgi:hypothetical protein
LIESFYQSIVEGTSVPIPYREILLTAQIMDAIFNQLDAARSLVHAPSARLEILAYQQAPMAFRTCEKARSGHEKEISE